MPVISWIICLVITGISPFGEKTILTGDITYQFIDYLSYFKSIILDNNDFTYTFSKTMGGDMAGFSAYYLSSPFNFLMLLFSNRNLPYGFMIMIIFKAGLMGLSFNYLLSRLYGQRLESLIFSTSYALMGYIVVYYQLYAYFDSLILLPFIILGMHKIYENPKEKLTYIISLFLAVIINYYVGWMICIFCAIYYIYICFINGIKKESVVSFIISSIIGGMLSAYKLITALLSMRGEKDNFNFGICRNFKMMQLFSRLYPNSFKGNISTCLPNIYCGLLIILLITIYFINKRIPIRERIASFLLLTILLINMYISIFNIVWHGLNQPIGFPYRYSFTVTIVLLLLSYKALLELRDLSVKIPVFTFLIVFILYSIFIVLTGSEVVGKKEIVLSLIIVLLINLAILLYRRNSIQWTVFLLIIFIINYSELVINQVNSFKYFDLANINEYQDYIDQVGDIIEEIKNNDSDFYRIEKYFKRSHNDSMQFNYNGLTHYSSCEKKEYINFMGKMGFRDNGNWSFYDRGSTTFVDSLFGIKYILSQYDSTGKPYTNVGSKNHYYIYRNDYALPLAFIADDQVKNITINKEETDTFKIQNNIADNINGKENKIFIPINIEKKIVNLSEEIRDGYTNYKKIDSDKDAYIEYIIPLSEKIAECYFSAPTTQNVELWSDGEFDINYFSQYSWNVYDLGTEKKDRQQTTIALKPLSDEMNISGEYFYYEDYNSLSNWYQEVANNKCELNKITSSHLEGLINSDKDGELVFSFPYDEAWKIYIDDLPVKNENSVGIFLSTPITPGKHFIKIIYKPEGKILGIGISIITFLLLIVVIIRDKYYILCIKKKLKKM